METLLSIVATVAIATIGVVAWVVYGAIEVMK